jgi:hypothetical protein
VRMAQPVVVPRSSARIERHEKVVAAGLAPAAGRLKVVSAMMASLIGVVVVRAATAVFLAELAVVVRSVDRGLVRGGARAPGTRPAARAPTPWGWEWENPLGAVLPHPRRGWVSPPQLDWAVKALMSLKKIKLGRHGIGIPFPT